jgi:glutamine synthetase
MTAFAQRCGIHDMPRAAACEQVLKAIAEQHIERVRIGWCDLHGVLRGKTLMAHAVADALHEGIGLVSTVMLKDTSDRTAFKVFEPGLADELPGFRQANNLMLLPDPASFRVLPWSPSTAWMQAQPWFDHASRCSSIHGVRCRWRSDAWQTLACTCAAGSRSNSTSTASTSRGSTPIWPRGRASPRACR